MRFYLLLILLLTHYITISSKLLADCQFAKEANISLSCIQTLQVDSDLTFMAFCDAEGWTVFQSRGQFGNPSDFFIKPWQDFKEGFGTPG